MSFGQRVWVGAAFIVSLGSMLVWAGNVRADTTTQPSIQMAQCAGCSAAQMQQKAISIPLFGIAFVYDYTTNTVRKYNRYEDTTCGPTPASGTTPGVARLGESGSTPDCGAFKAADEMQPVDPIMLTAFSTMTSVQHSDPALLSTGVERVPIELLGDSGGGDFFDPSHVASNYPQGEYQQFEQAVSNALHDTQDAAALSQALSDVLYGINVTFATNVTITGVGVAEFVTGKIDFDFRAAQGVTIDFYNSAGDYVEVTVTVSSTRAVDFTYEGAFDPEGNRYPEHNSHLPGSPHWNWHGPHGGGDSNHFGQNLGANGFGNVPTGPLCGLGYDTWLWSDWDGDELIDYYWTCVQP